MTSAEHHSAMPPFFEAHRADTAYVHESSYIEDPCRIGEHTSILHFSHIMAHAVIGNHCLIGRNVGIASGVLVGDNVRVMHNSQLNSGVILENSVYCGPSVVFAESRFIRANPRNISRITPTLVRRGAQLGPNSTVASGSTIGRYAFIEAGTIVDRNIPDFAVVYGNPLKVAGWRCECGHTLPLNATDEDAQEIRCSYCSRQYARQSRWKILQLNRGDTALDSHSESEPSIRTAQGQD